MPIQLLEYVGEGIVPNTHLVQIAVDDFIDTFVLTDHEFDNLLVEDNGVVINCNDLSVTFSNKVLAHKFISELNKHEDNRLHSYFFQ